jgi:chitodextrinase
VAVAAAVLLSVCFAQAATPPPTLTASAGAPGAISLVWTDVSSLERSYSIERSLSPTSGFTQVASTKRNVVAYTDAGLNAGTTYYYRVRAMRRKQPGSPYSNVASATTSATADVASPATPTGVSASAITCSQTLVSWNTSADTGGSGLKGYNVYRNGAFLRLVLAPGTSTDDTGRSPSTTYTYTVRALDNAGNVSAQSSAASATTPACPDTTAPSVPGGATAVATSCSDVDVFWNTSTDTGGSGLRGYNVYRNGTFLRLVLAPAQTTRDTGRAASTAYAYTVAAVDNAGNASAQSGAAGATTPACANQPPVANAGPDVYTQSLTTNTFNGSASSDADGSIASYAWSFGDGASASGATVSHAYAAPGNYTVTLTVTDNRATTDTDTATVSASNRAPTANAGPDKSGTAGVALSFASTGSSDPDGTITTYSWTFGDGGTAAGANPNHAYATPGTYIARLTVTDDDGAQSSDTATVTIGAAASGGALTWGMRLGSTSADIGYAIEADAAGDVFVAGQIMGTVDLGDGPYTAPAARMRSLRSTRRPERRCGRSGSAAPTSTSLRRWRSIPPAM